LVVKSITTKEVECSVNRSDIQFSYFDMAIISGDHGFAELLERGGV
jgi:hypothetical protein